MQNQIWAEFGIALGKIQSCTVRLQDALDERSHFLAMRDYITQQLAILTASAIEGFTILHHEDIRPIPPALRRHGAAYGVEMLDHMLHTTWLSEKPMSIASYADYCKERFSLTRG